MGERAKMPPGATGIGPAKSPGENGFTAEQYAADVPSQLIGMIESDGALSFHCTESPLVMVTVCGENVPSAFTLTTCVVAASSSAVASMEKRRAKRMSVYCGAGSPTRPRPG